MLSHFGHTTVIRLYSDRDGRDVMDLIYDHTIDKLSLGWIDDPLLKIYCCYFQSLNPFISYKWSGIPNRLNIR